MTLTIDTLSEYGRQRLNLPPSELPRLRSYATTALSDLARKTVNDYTKRRLLLTDHSVVTATITSSNGQYYADLTTIINNYGVMPDYMQYGTVYHLPTSHTWTPTYVTLDGAVRVSGSGSVDVGGKYAKRGTSAGKNYYNLIGQATSTANSAVVWVSTQWQITDSVSDGDYYSLDAVATPELVTTWVVGDGIAPVPTVSVSDSYTLTIVGHGYEQGQAVRLTTAGDLPTPLLVSTTYYVIKIDDDSIQLAFSADDAASGTPIQLQDVGAGTSTIAEYGSDQTIVQWIDVPAFANLDTGCPIEFVYGWLLENRLYLSGITGGTLAFAVPFTPLLSQFDGNNASLSLLEQDLIDSLVAIAVTAGLEPKVSEAI